MKQKVYISDEIHAEAKVEAARRRITLRQFVEDLLTAAIENPADARRLGLEPQLRREEVSA